MPELRSRSTRLHQALTDLLTQTPELEAAAVVSFDGLPMASALPPAMDEDRVAAMSAALLSLGERAAEGLGRGELSQVYIEGATGTVFLVSADDEAVLVAVAARSAKAGLMLFELRRAAAVVAGALRTPAEVPAAAPEPTEAPAAAVLPPVAAGPAAALAPPVADGPAAAVAPAVAAAPAAAVAPAVAAAPGFAADPLTAPLPVLDGGFYATPAVPAQPYAPAGSASDPGWAHDGERPGVEPASWS